MKASIFIATSLDGYIARKNGDIDFLSGNESQNPEKDYGYKEFIDSVDALVMGRNSFEKVLTCGEWPYGNKPVFVLSSKQVKIPQELPDCVEAVSCSPKELASLLSKRGMSHLYIDGGKTIQSFLQARLIQTLIITRIPILIGSGIPLFGNLEQDIKLKHIKTQQFDSGLVQSRYKVIA
jgi:dihydrofolate reductase